MKIATPSQEYLSSHFPQHFVGPPHVDGWQVLPAYFSELSASSQPTQTKPFPPVSASVRMPAYHLLCSMFDSDHPAIEEEKILTRVAEVHSIDPEIQLR